MFFLTQQRLADTGADIVSVAYVHCVGRAAVKLEHDYLVFLFQKNTGYIQRPLRSDIPVSAEIKAVYEDVTLPKARHIHETALAGLGAEASGEEAVRV